MHLIAGVKPTTLSYKYLKSQILVTRFPIKAKTYLTYMRIFMRSEVKLFPFIGK